MRFFLVFLFLVQPLFSQDRVPDFFSLTNTVKNFQQTHFDEKSKLWRTYLKWYHLKPSSLKHFRAGWIASPTARLIAYEFVPKITIGSIVLIHGYLSHTGDFSRLIRYLLRNHYKVLAFDLPGHGFSSGERTGINHFSDYLSSYNSFLSTVRDEIDFPLFFIGHSTGCAVDLEYIATEKTQLPFSLHIWLAPLVRISSWQLAGFGSAVLSPFTKDVPRPFIPASSNEKFNYFVEHLDPLQPRVIATSWAKALFEWDSINQQYGQISNKVVVIQGTADTVVDWHYNLSYYTNHLKKLEVHLITNAKHHLAVEAAKYRNQVFRIIRKGLQKSNTNQIKRSFVKTSTSNSNTAIKEN